MLESKQLESSLRTGTIPGGSFPATLMTIMTLRMAGRIRRGENVSLPLLLFRCKRVLHACRFQHKKKIALEMFRLPSWSPACSVLSFHLGTDSPRGGGVTDGRTPRRRPDCDEIITAHHLNVVAGGCFISRQSIHLASRCFRHQCAHCRGDEGK